MAKNVEFRSGNVVFSLSTDLEAEIERALGEAERAVIAAVEAERDQVFAQARQYWPVETGKSRDGLVTYTQIDLVTGKVKAGIRNPVAYARWVRLPKRGFALSGLLRGPMRRAGKRLVKNIGADLEKVLNRELPTGER